MISDPPHKAPTNPSLFLAHLILSDFPTFSPFSRIKTVKEQLKTFGATQGSDSGLACWFSQQSSCWMWALCCQHPPSPSRRGQ